MSTKSVTKISGKQRILCAARTLMIAQGYIGSSVDQICAAADVQKGTFFYHFKNKEALGVALVSYHLTMGAEMIQTAPFMNEAVPIKKLMKYIDFIIKSITDPVQQGCLLGVFSNEIATHKKSIQDACKMGFDLWSQQLEAMIKAAAKNSNRKNIKARELASFFIVIFEGSLVLARGTDQVSHIKTSLSHYKTYLKNILID